MEIASIYAKNLQPKTESQYIPENSSGKGFSEYINKAEDKSLQPQKTEKTSKSSVNGFKKVSGKQEKSSDVNKQENINNERKPDTEDAVTKESSNSNETLKAESKQIDKTEANQNNAVDETDNSIDAVSNQIIINIANMLNITPEQVKEHLAKLNIQPLDLVNNEALGSFVCEVYGVESNAELLNIPNVNETFKAVNEAVLSAMQAVKPETKNANQPVSNETVKGLSMNETTATNEVFIADVSQTVSGSDSEKNLNQNSSQQSTDLNSSFTQTENTEVIVEQSNDESVVVTVNNTNEGTRTVRVEARTAAERPFNQTEVVKQVVEYIKTDIKGNVSEVKMLLKPESLGELTLKISMENGIVTAQFLAENQRVKEIIESNFNELKNALSQSGVDVGALSVSVSSDNENEAMHAYERERQKSAKRISKIIADINNTADLPLEAKLVNENDVLNTQVNYTV